MSLLSLIVYSKVRLFPVVFSFEVNILLYRLNDFNVHLSAQMIILTGVACAVAVVMFCLKVKFPHELHIRLPTDTIPTRASSLRVCLSNLRRWTLAHVVGVASVASVAVAMLLLGSFVCCRT